MRPLPGPETGVFGVYAPCAPIQKSHTKRMKTLRALNRPKAARTSAQEDDRAVQRATPPRDCPAGRIILRQCTPPSSSGPEIGSSPALQRVQGSRTRPSARCTAARHRHLRGRRERDSIAPRSPGAVCYSAYLLCCKWRGSTAGSLNPGGPAAGAVPAMSERKYMSQSKKMKPPPARSAGTWRLR